jgi:hypothetical protein
LYNFSRSTTFILVICSSDIVVATLFRKLRDLSSSLHETIYRDVDFMNNVNITLSNEEITNTKVVDLEKLYNFVVKHFLI